MATIDDAKLVAYLLNTAHPQGGAKAMVFLRYGFSPDAPEDLRRALLELVTRAPISRERQTSFARIVTVDGEISIPTGRPLRLRTVWELRVSGEPPRCVTAYPLRPTR